jgi:hypothetical protein
VNISLVGFHLRINPQLDLEEFFSALTAPDTPYRIDDFGYPRLLAWTDQGDYLAGILLTFKDQRKQTVIEDSTFQVSVAELEAGKSYVDFNYFVIHKQTRRGAYQYYHHSCSIHQFCRLLQREYAGVLERLKEDQLRARGGNRASSRDRREIGRRFKDKLRYTLILRQESFQELLLELEKVKKFEFDAEFIYATNPIFRSLRTSVRTNRHKFTFDARADQTNLKRRILEVLGIEEQPNPGATASSATSTPGTRFARVEGVDVEGNERTFRLQNNPDSFGDTDYDSMVQDGTIDLESILESPIIEWIFERIEENRHHFETEAS